MDNFLDSFFSIPFFFAENSAPSLCLHLCSVHFALSFRTDHFMDYKIRILT